MFLCHVTLIKASEQPVKHLLRTYAHLLTINKSEFQLINEQEALWVKKKKNINSCWFMVLSLTSAM